MADPSPADADAEAAVWEFTRLGDYALPSPPTAGAAADAWASLKRLLRPAREEETAPFKEEAALRALSEVRLAHLTPPLDWRAPAEALCEALGDRPATDGGRTPLRFVVGQPHAGHEAIVRHWAARREAVLVEPPDPRVLTGSGSRFDAWPDGDRPWAIPALERWFLRHANGLALVRELLDRGEGGRLGHGLIGCDSWAWAYLQHIWQVPRPDALTLQAFDGRRLARLLSGMETRRRSERLVFRNARTGSDILSVPMEEDEVGNELAQLAAHCRGNVGTALSYWRQRLRADPDHGEVEVEEDIARAETVWVSAAALEPVLPAENEEDTALLLHALLLHGGLAPALLPLVTPVPAARCAALLHRLRRAGVVRDHGPRCRVAELAAATVRALLVSRGYLVDDF